MKTFYGQVEGMANTRAARTGSRASHIRSSVQSKERSVITELYFDNADVLKLRVEVANGTRFHGDRVFDGPVDDFVRKLEA